MATKKNTRAKASRSTKQPRASASEPAKKKTAKRPAKKKTAVDLITVGITPPWLAPDSMAESLYKQFGNKATRPPPDELAIFPWFRQDEAYQIGYYLLTHGLREHADHPEIELCNVPGVFIPAATNLLNWIADYVLEGGRLAHGESMQMSDEYLKVIAFKEIAPGTEGTSHDGPVLRVLFLC